jgi:hypothetical protein
MWSAITLDDADLPAYFAMYEKAVVVLSPERTEETGKLTGEKKGLTTAISSPFAFVPPPPSVLSSQAETNCTWI